MRKVKVWDRFVRLSHWALGLLVLGSFLTSEEDRLTAIHVSIRCTDPVWRPPAERRTLGAWILAASEPLRRRTGQTT